MGPLILRELERKWWALLAFAGNGRGSRLNLGSAVG